MTVLLGALPLDESYLGFASGGEVPDRRVNTGRAGATSARATASLTEMIHSAIPFEHDMVSCTERRRSRRPERHHPPNGQVWTKDVLQRCGIDNKTSESVRSHHQR
jgi:hypothetical protein